jgi:hypothetical protein
MASVVFMLIPGGWLAKLRSAKTGAYYKGAVREKEYQLSKAALASAALEEIYGILKRGGRGRAQRQRHSLRFRRGCGGGLQALPEAGRMLEPQV